jgi:hypothetical protein
MEAISSKAVKRGRPRKSRPAISYNLVATRKHFINSGRKYRPWATEKSRKQPFRDLNPETFAKFMGGTFVPAPGGETERLFLEALESDGLLVLRKRKAVDCSAS